MPLKAAARTEACAYYASCKVRKTSDVVPVREVRDSTLPGPAGDIPIRIYSPAPADAGPQAGLVYFHGGASE